MIQRLIEPEDRTFLAGPYHFEDKCCKLNPIAWWPANGSGVGIIGVRHGGPTCAGRVMVIDSLKYLRTGRIWAPPKGRSKP